jgi:uncharacterized RDD family membrane protein YckC
VAPAEPVVAPGQTHVLVRRYVAHWVDSMLFVALWIVAIVGCSALPEGPLGDAVFIAVAIGGLTVGHVAFFVLLHRRRGSSPGKRLVRIRVVDGAGETPSVGALVKRSIPLLVEYFYVIALAGMMSSEHRQRWGDRWGKTYVVADT